ncbi:hypothetical protein FRB96_007875 [Tulasnella sp. 330]|nr:hypothetical protein FRB96_007875 [Tulasnella sp. 330]
MTSATSVTVDASDSVISSVVVFRKAAEVTRTFSVALQTGQNEIKVKSLPSSLLSDAIRVEGLGDGVTVMDVISKPPPYTPFVFGVKSYSKRGEELQDEKKLLEAQLKVLQAQGEVLYTYSKSMSVEHIVPKDLIKYMEDFQLSGARNVEAVRDKEKEIRDLNVQIEKESQNPTSTVDRSHQRKGTVSAVVQSEKDVQAELTLVYMTPSARWDPCYEVRAKTGAAGQVSKEIALHHRALISQSSGEDWTNTSITLSTAEPGQGHAVPALSPIKIKPQVLAFGSFASNTNTGLFQQPKPLAFGQPAQNTASLFGAAPQPQQTNAFGQTTTSTGGLFGQAQQQQALGQMQQQQQRSAGSAFGGGGLFGSTNTTTSQPITGSLFGGPANNTSSSGTSLFGSAPPQPSTSVGSFGTQNVEPAASAALAPQVGLPTEDEDDTLKPFAHASAVSAANAVGATYAIAGKSTIPSDSATHRVALSVSKALEADISVVTVPRARPTAFVQGEIKNTTSDTLLPGSASIYMDDSYVSQHTIDLVGPGESFTCSFGVEHNIRVLFSHSEGTPTTTGWGFGQQHVTTVQCSNTITVTNAKNAPISKLIIRDAVPVAPHPFKVEIKSPAGLASLEPDGEIHSSGIATRWSKGKAKSRDDGLIEFVVSNLAAGAEKKVVVAWVVESPQGVKWSHSLTVSSVPNVRVSTERPFRLNPLIISLGHEAAFKTPHDLEEYMETQSKPTQHRNQSKQPPSHPVADYVHPGHHHVRSPFQLGRIKTKLKRAQSSEALTSPVDLSGPAPNPKAEGDYFAPRATRPHGHGHVLHRLQALFPASSTPPPAGKVTGTPHAAPQIPELKLASDSLSPGPYPFAPKKKEDPPFLKGDLSTLLGHVPPYEPPSDRQQDTLPRFAADSQHPYHIVVVAGQECPSQSNIPLGIGAGMKLDILERMEKKRSKTESRTELGKPLDVFKDGSPDLGAPPVTVRDYAHPIPSPSPNSAGFAPSPGRASSPSPFQQVHGPSAYSIKSNTSQASIGQHHPVGWSMMLEDWFCNGAGSLPGAKPAIDCKESMVEAPAPRQPDRQVPSAYMTGRSLISHGILPKMDQQRAAQSLSTHDCSRSNVKAGLIGGRVGNKGGIGVSMKVAGTSLLFVNAHLAAHEDRAAERVANMVKIKSELELDNYLRHDDPRAMKEDITDRYDHTFIFGDLNFRLNVTRLHAEWLISRKDYANALQFDQLKDVMRNDSVFSGFEEAPIDFDPTFKYDVLHTLKKHRSVRKAITDRAARHLRQSKRAAGLVDEVEDGDDSDESTSEEEDGQDVKSLSSSVWTAAQSVHTADADDDGAHELDLALIPAAENAKMNAGSSSPFKTPVLLHHPAAHRAKEKLLGLLQRNSSSPSVTRSVPSADTLAAQLAQQRNHAPQYMGAPPMTRSARTSVEVPRLTTDPNKSPLLRRGTSIKSGHTPDDNLDVPATDRGVYDSSSKQRVPSWCDRILFKSTIIPEVGDDEPEEEPGQPRFSAFRVSQIFANFMRHRKDSNLSIGSTAESTAAVSVGAVSVAHNTMNPISPQSADEAQQPLSINALRLDSPEPSPARPKALNFNKPPSSKAYPQKSPPTSPRSASAEGIGMALRRSMSGPVTSASPVVSTPLTMASVVVSESPVGQASPDDQPRKLSHSSSVWSPSPQSSTRRWIFPFGSSSREPTPTPPTVPLPQVEVAPHRRGDMVCLDYNTLDDRQMRRLEARSDHRPVVGDFAIYV